MDLKLNKAKEQEEDTRIRNSNMYRYDMNLPRDIRYSVVKHNCFPRFQTNWQCYVKPLIDITPLTTNNKDA